MSNENKNVEEVTDENVEEVTDEATELVETEPTFWQKAGCVMKTKVVPGAKKVLKVTAVAGLAFVAGALVAKNADSEYGSGDSDDDDYLKDLDIDLPETDYTITDVTLDDIEE